MANRYWVGGSGNWSDTAHWSTASNGSTGASVPTAADDVIFDASSDSGSAITVTLTAGSTCLGLNFSGIDQNVSFTGSFTLSALGNLVLSGSKTVDVTGITALALTATTTRNLTANGGTLTGGLTLNSTTGTWTLLDNFTITGVLTHSAGTLAFGGKTFSARIYTSTTTSTRALNFTTAGSTLSVGNSTTAETVFNMTSATGLTVTSPSTSLVDIVGSSNVQRTINTTVFTSATALNFQYSATVGLITPTNANAYRNLTISTASIVNVEIFGTTVYGSFVYTSGILAPSGSPTLTLSTVLGISSTFTASGPTALDFNVTITGGNTGAYTLGSNVTVGSSASRTFTLSQGVLNLSSYVLTVYGQFNSSGIAVRTLNFGTGFIDLTLDGATATTIWDTTTVTSFTVSNSATGSVRIKGSGSLVRSVNTGGLSEANSLSFEFLSTAGTITLTNATSRIKNFIINCAGTTISNAVIAIYGNFTHTAGTLSAGTNTLTFSATSGTQTISSVANLDFPITFAGTATYSILSNINIGTTTSRLVNLTTGTIELNSYALTIYGQFNPTGTGTRKIQMSGSGGKIVLSLDTASTVYNNGTVTGFTTDGNVLIQLTGGGAVQKTISAGAGTEAQAISFQLSTAAGTVAFTAGNTIRNLTIDNNSFTLSNIAITVYGNLLVSGTTPTLTAGANAWTFAATSSKTITTSGKTLDFPLTFNSSSGTWALQDALTVGTSTSRQVTLTAGTLELNSYTLTLFGIFSSNAASGTRRIQMSGTGGKIVINFNATATVFDNSSVTNMTTDGNVVVQITGGGAAQTLTIDSKLSGLNTISFQVSITTGTIAFSSACNMKNITFDNNTYTVAYGATSPTVYGNFTISGTSPTLNTASSPWTFAGTVGTQTITTNGKALPFPLTFSGTAIYSLGSALSISSTGTITLTTGTIELNSYTLTIPGIFSSTGSGVRKIQMSGAGGKIVLSSATAATIWDTGVVTNMTTDGNVLVQLTGGGATVKTINSGALSEANSISFQLSTTAGTVTFTASNTVENLTIDNNTFTISNIALTIYGNLLLSGTSPTLTAGTNTWTFGATSSKIITTSGKTLDFPVTFDGVGGAWVLQDALTVGSTRQVDFSAGTINLNSLTMTVGYFSSSSTGTKVLAHGTNGNLVVTGNDSVGVAFNFLGATNLTYTGTGIINMTASTAKTFNGGGNSFNTLNQGGLGNLSISGDNTYYNITNTVVPCTIIFDSGGTHTFSNFSLAGTSGNYVTITSALSTPHTLVLLSGGFTGSYFLISKSNATGGTGWYAYDSIDGGNNTGWIISGAVSGATSTFLIFFFS